MRPLHCIKTPFYGVTILLLVMLAGTFTASAAGQTPTDPLPSWNDGSTKQAILAFVAEVTNPRSSNYVLPAERIACFDNDGTLWPENPIPVQMAFVLDELKRLSPSHPEWKNNEAIQAALKGDIEALKAGGKKSFEQALFEIVYATHAGVTVNEFNERVRNWLKTARHPRFNRPYTDLAYQPMLEVLELLRANGFKTFIVSGGGADFMRVFSEELYGIPPQQTIGSYGKAKYELQNDKPTIIKEPDIVLVNNAGNKAVTIHQFIGRRPIACFGNSDGDIEMLEWTTIGRKPSFGLLVHHTDAERAYAYNKNPGSSGSLVRGLTEAPKRGWLMADMKNDWKTVFRYEGDQEVWSKSYGLSRLNTEGFTLEAYLADLNWMIEDPKYKDPNFTVPKLVLELWKIIGAMEGEAIHVLNQGPPYQPKFALDGAFIPYWIEKLYPTEWVAWLKAMGMADVKITDDMVRAWQPQLDDVVALSDGTLISQQRFSHFDPGWTILVPDYIGMLLKPDMKPPFATNPAQLKISNTESLSIALAGDWGSGTWFDGDNQLCPADAVMQQINRLGVDYTIHLGDVYYTGTDPFIDHFAEQWMPGRRGAFAINGNHEMYDWGKGYFEKALTHPTFAAQQGTSYFSIEFGDWIVVGLDSAYYDESPILSTGTVSDENQKAFLRDIRKHADRKKKRIILLTHHTGLNKDGTKRTKLWNDIVAPDALGKAPDYWYWAHEHLGIVYSSSSAAGRDTVVRTVGHGGVPFVSAWDLEAHTGPGKPIEYFAQTPYGDGISEHRRRVMNGFVVITLTRDGRLTEKFINQKGDVEWASPR